ncbi:MAG: PilW family protein [Chitinivibrionales bacterium]
MVGSIKKVREGSGGKSVKVLSIDSRGVTLLELLIAMTMAVTITGAVLFAWNHYSISLIEQRRSRISYEEAYTVGDYLVKRIRRADKVMSVDPSSITLINEGDRDTFQLSFNDTALCIDREPKMHFISDIVIDDFGFEVLDENSEKGFALLLIEYGVENSEARIKWFKRIITVSYKGWDTDQREGMF